MMKASSLSREQFHFMRFLKQSATSQTMKSLILSVKKKKKKREPSLPSSFTITEFGKT